MLFTFWYVPFTRLGQCLSDEQANNPTSKTKHIKLRMYFMFYT